MKDKAFSSNNKTLEDSRTQLDLKAQRETHVERRPNESLTDYAYRQIEDMIVCLELEPGSWIAEPKLAEHLGLGRTPIREALVRLACERLVEARPRRGMAVREISPVTQLRCLEMRRPIEVALVQAAAKRITDSEREYLRKLIDAFRSLKGSGDHVGLLRIDRAFIDHLIVASKNEFFADLLPLYALGRRFWFAYRDRQSAFEVDTLTEYHIRIGSLIEDKDQEAVRALAEEYLDYVEAFARYVATDII